jgi:hypothetical protein
MRKKKRLEVYQAAVTLARSGKERDWKSIQNKLVAPQIFWTTPRSGPY